MVSFIIWTLVLLFVLWFISIYNGLVKLRNRTKEAWADIDVQLKRRYNLIPNLVNTVKGYATHEREVFENVAKARSEAMQSKEVGERMEKENALTQTLKSLFAVAENYPQLKASQNFLDLQGQLTDTENKIQAARRFYNANVRDLNIRIESFPSNIVAKIGRFKKMKLFEVQEGEVRAVPKVKF